MRNPITVRGDSLYCPLPLSIEPYWWCEPNCFHCYFRGLNHVWGKDLRPIDLDVLDRKLKAGLKNKNPKTKLAHLLARKKTIRLGNKTDPFQPVERHYRCSAGAIKILIRHDWTFVVQTRFTRILRELSEEDLYTANHKELVTILPIISPGGEKDWELFERKRTTSVSRRFKDIEHWIKLGVPVGVNGEPFIPGHHTVKDFENIIRRLKSVGCKRYNTHNFHFTPFVAKRIVNLPGVDIERIWYNNQDHRWKRILVKLIEIAQKQDMILGVPDFVNSGPGHVEKANTCCGIDVSNPTTFNTHYFKKLAQQGFSSQEILKTCWDGSGDWDQGRKIVEGKLDGFYTLKDAGL